VERDYAIIYVVKLGYSKGNQFGQGHKNTQATATCS